MIGESYHVLQETFFLLASPWHFKKPSFSKFLSHNSIIHDLTCVNIPQQYGVAKRKNCHPLVVRASFFYMHVPKSYQGEVGLMVPYLINRLHICVFNDIIPNEFIFSFVPSSRLVYLVGYLDVLFLSLIILVTVNYILEHLNMFLLVIPLTEGGTNALWISPFTKQIFFCQPSRFKERKHLK